MDRSEPVISDIIKPTIIALFERNEQVRKKKETSTIAIQTDELKEEPIQKETKNSHQDNTATDDTYRS